MASGDPGSEHSKEIPGPPPAAVPGGEDLPGPPVEEPVAAVLPAPRPPYPSFGWACFWCVGFLLLSLVAMGGGFAVALLVQIALSPNRADLLHQAMKDPGFTGSAEFQELTPVALLAGYCAGEVVLVGAVWLLIRRVVGRDWMRILALRLPSLPHLLLALLSLPAMLLLPGGVLELLRNLGIPTLFDQAETGTLFAKWPAWVGVLVIGLGPGLSEELFCRGFLGRGLVGRYGPITGVLLTSWLFGMLHLDPVYAVAMTFFGAWLHVVYLTSRSLLLPMLLHFLNNSVAILTARNDTLGTLDAKTEGLPVSVYAAALLLVATVGWALYHCRAQLVTSAEGDKLPWHPNYPGVAYPPAGRATMVVRPWPEWQVVGMVVAAFLIFVGDAAVFLMR